MHTVPDLPDTSHPTVSCTRGRVARVAQAAPADALTTPDLAPSCWGTSKVTDHPKLGKRSHTGNTGTPINAGSVPRMHMAVRNLQHSGAGGCRALCQAARTSRRGPRCSEGCQLPPCCHSGARLRTHESAPAALFSTEGQRRRCSTRGLRRGRQRWRRGTGGS